MIVRSQTPTVNGPFVAAILIAMGLALQACADASNAEAVKGTDAPSVLTAPGAGTVVLSAEEMQAGGIVVAPPQADRRMGEFTASAVLQLDETRTARLGSIVDGVVADTPVAVGVRVQRGARLASIHSHVVHDAWAGYRRALAERRRAATELAFAREAEARVTRLLATKAASRQEAERAQTDRAAAEETLVVAESEVRRALDELEHLGLQSEPDASRADTDRVPVTTTMAGVVLERLITTGTAVTAGTPLFVVSDLSRLWAIAEIDEGQLPLVAVGRTATLSVPAYPARTFAGRIIAIGDTVNPETRRVTVRIDVANSDGSLKPQMFASVRLANGEQEPVLLVPTAAVQKVDQQAVVFVEAEAGRFERRRVETGTDREGRIEIRHGLAPHERVATTGTFLLKSKFLEAGPAE